MLPNEDPGQMHIFFNQLKHFLRFLMIVNSQILYYTFVTNKERNVNFLFCTIQLYTILKFINNSCRGNNGNHYSEGGLDM